MESMLEFQEDTSLTIEGVGRSQPKRREFYGTTNIANVTTDACGIIDRYGVRILTAVTKAVEHDAPPLSTFKQTDLLALIIYWYGKLLEDRECEQTCCTSY